MRVVLLGMKHCGKSTLGKRLAVHLRCEFYDLDSLIEAEHWRQTGDLWSVREIYAAKGEHYFADLEARAAARLREDCDESEDSAVIALGGTTAMNPAALPSIRALGLKIYLKVPVDEMFRRVARGGIPPFLRKEHAAADFAALLAAREPHYEQLADATLELANLPVDEALARLIDCIEEHADGG